MGRWTCTRPTPTVTWHRRPASPRACTAPSPWSSTHQATCGWPTKIPATSFEFTKAQLATPNPVPAVTIFAESGALANPFGMAFDHSGNLWVVSNTSSRVYEYTKSQLASSGSPTPHTTISDFPSTPVFGDAFDASGDLWVSTVQAAWSSSRRPSWPRRTRRRRSRSLRPVAPNLSSRPRGTCGWSPGVARDCFGTPCTNELVEFTKAQLSTSGSPTPAVTISSTKAGPAGSLYGPYSLAFDLLR